MMLVRTSQTKRIVADGVWNMHILNSCYYINSGSKISTSFVCESLELK